MSDRRRAYRIVDEFEKALCQYTGAPDAIAVNSCTDAIFLCFAYIAGTLHPGDYLSTVQIPKHTYAGVVQAVKRAGFPYEFVDLEWEGRHMLDPYAIVDAAKFFERGMFNGAFGGHPADMSQCVSFGASKRLNIGRGGAILTSNSALAEWVRPRIMDGRKAGEDYMNPTFVSPAWRLNMLPEWAARGLDLLTYLDDPPSDTWESYPDLSKAEWN